MSLFRDAIDKRAENTMALSPAIQTGFLINTSNVLESFKEDFWFKSLNNMSALQFDRLLESDSIKTGVSIGLKDTNGVNRKEQIFCNPKFADLQIAGDGTGKRSIDEGPGMLQADAIFSGNNNQLPTIVGIQKIPTKIHETTTITKKDITTNTSPPPLEGEISDGFAPFVPTPDMISPIKRTQEIGNGSAAPNLLNKEGKETKKKDQTQRGVYFNSIRTGTLKITNSELSSLASMTFTGLDGII